jgi:hypothetical protein
MIFLAADESLTVDVHRLFLAVFAPVSSNTVYAKRVFCSFSNSFEDGVRSVSHVKKWSI